MQIHDYSKVKSEQRFGAVMASPGSNKVIGQGLGATFDGSQFRNTTNTVYVNAASLLGASANSLVNPEQ